MGALVPLTTAVSVRDPPAVLSRILGIVYRTLSTLLIRRAELCVSAGAVTLIQRFGSVQWLRARAREGAGLTPRPRGRFRGGR